MSRLYPLTFQPRFKERVWGGRSLERLYGKPLPPSRPIGESWEISDRPGDVSVVANGVFAGRDLHWLVEQHPGDLLGEAQLAARRFPLLIKLLDARQKLSLQVHPPATAAVALQGEPKTELWFVAEAAPGAELYVGLKRGVTREDFERRLADGRVADCFHRVPVRAGDAMFLPSGRVHAIGAGLVIFEIQQNSDTTYRVFDWNRPGLDGRPRELHVTQSLASIDFDDFAPGLVAATAVQDGNFHRCELVRDPLFTVERYGVTGAGQVQLPQGRMQILGVVRGEVRLPDLVVRAGGFVLLPAGRPAGELRAARHTEFLRIEAGVGA